MGGFYPAQMAGFYPTQMAGLLPIRWERFGLCPQYGVHGSTHFLGPSCHRSFGHVRRDGNQVFPYGGRAIAKEGLEMARPVILCAIGALNGIGGGLILLWAAGSLDCFSLSYITLGGGR